MKPALASKQQTENSPFPPTLTSKKRSIWAERGAPRTRKLLFLHPINAAYVITHSAPRSCPANTPTPTRRFPHRTLTTTTPSAKPRPRPPNPAPRRPSGHYAHARKCVPAPALSFARIVPVPALSPHSSRCWWRVPGREQPRAASPRPSGRAGARSPVPSTPLPRRVREGPSRCRVPEGLRGRRRHGSRWSRRISIR